MQRDHCPGFDISLNKPARGEFGVSWENMNIVWILVEIMQRLLIEKQIIKKYMISFQLNPHTYVHTYIESDPE